MKRVERRNYSAGIADFESIFDLIKDIIRLRITDIPRIKDESMPSNFRLKKIKRTPNDLLKNK